MTNDSPFSPASRERKTKKTLIWGLPGSGKSWASLHGEKTICVLDLEGRAGIYAELFDFDVLKTTYVTEFKQAIFWLKKNPGLYKTLVIDSLSVYWHELQKHWSKIFIKRNPSSYTANKEDFYDLGPKEWATIKNDWNSTFEFLMVMDINLICIARETEKLRSEGGRFISEGPKPDCEKGTPYLFDTVLYLYKSEKKYYARVDKDCLSSLGGDGPFEVTPDFLSKFSLPHMVVKKKDNT